MSGASAAHAKDGRKYLVGRTPMRSTANNLQDRRNYIYITGTSVHIRLGAGD